MRIKAERVEGKYLKRGDFFTDHPPEYFNASNKATLLVFICMHPMPDDDETYFRLTTVEDPVAVSVPVPSVPDTSKVMYDSTDLWTALYTTNRDAK